MFRITGGLKAESGRLQHFSAGENDCGLRITKVEAKDDGVWACNVGVAEDGEVVYYPSAIITGFFSPIFVKLKAILTLEIF